MYNNIKNIQKLTHIYESGNLNINEFRGSYLNNGWRLFEGPAKEALNFLDDECIDCVVTSPPYFWLRDEIF